jgi:hypothetical protein
MKKNFKNSIFLSTHLLIFLAIRNINTCYDVEYCHLMKLTPFFTAKKNVLRCFARQNPFLLINVQGI